MNTRYKELQNVSLPYKNEHLEILKIIREDPIKYTETKWNFLNMVKLQPATIQKSTG